MEPIKSSVTRSPLKRFLLRNCSMNKDKYETMQVECYKRAHFDPFVRTSCTCSLHLRAIKIKPFRHKLKCICAFKHQTCLYRRWEIMSTVMRTRMNLQQCKFRADPLFRLNCYGKPLKSSLYSSYFFSCSFVPIQRRVFLTTLTAETSAR